MKAQDANSPSTPIYAPYAKREIFALVAKRRAETMEENRLRLIGAARKAFAASGFAAASMDDCQSGLEQVEFPPKHGRQAPHFGIEECDRSQQPIGQLTRRYGAGRTTFKVWAIWARFMK